MVSNTRNEYLESVNKNNVEKFLHHYEVVFDHVNIRVKPPKETRVGAYFDGVTYIMPSSFSDTIENVLSLAIYNLFKNEPLHRVSKEEFIEFVKTNYQVEILSMASMSLKKMYGPSALNPQPTM